MGPLAFLGSHPVNGVSALHTQLMKRTVSRALHGLYCGRIVNTTRTSTQPWRVEKADPEPEQPQWLAIASSLRIETAGLGQRLNLAVRISNWITRTAAGIVAVGVIRQGS